jgi:TPR repeat protein
MILRLLLATIIASLFAQPAHAISHAAQTCDELASHPQEPGHEGRGVEWGLVDAVPAIAACRAALAENPGSAEILYRLARTLMQLNQMAEAMPMMLRAAEAGYSPAETAYGTAYLGGQGVSPDLATAFEWLTRAAESGHPIGQYNLGLLHENGPAPYFDPPRAKALYELSIEQGYPLAMFALGQMYERGETGVAKDWAKSFALFQRAAQSDYVPAYFALGRAYSHGRGTRQDSAIAYGWWMKSALAGSPGGQLEVARALTYGLGIEQNLDAAVNWYRRSASSGYTVAQIDVGRLLLNENTNQTEIAEGIYWLKQAGDAGDLNGYQYLAEHYAMQNLLPLARHYAEIVAANSDGQLRNDAKNLLITLDELEARREQSAAPSP